MRNNAIPTFGRSFLTQNRCQDYQTPTKRPTTIRQWGNYVRKIIYLQVVTRGYEIRIYRRVKCFELQNRRRNDLYKTIGSVGVFTSRIRNYGWEISHREGVMREFVAVVVAGLIDT